MNIHWLEFWQDKSLSDDVQPLLKLVCAEYWLAIWEPCFKRPPKALYYAFLGIIPRSILTHQATNTMGISKSIRQGQNQVRNLTIYYNASRKGCCSDWHYSNGIGLDWHARAKNPEWRNRAPHWLHFWICRVYQLFCPLFDAGHIEFQPRPECGAKKSESLGQSILARWNFLWWKFF